MSIKIGNHLTIENPKCGMCSNYDIDSEWCRYFDLHNDPDDDACRGEGFQFMGFKEMKISGYTTKKPK